MKTSTKFLLGALMLVGLQFGGMTACVAEADVGGGGVYYGGDPWIHNDIWVSGGGRGFYGGDRGYEHPDRGHRR